MFEKLNPKETLLKLISIRDVLFIAGIGLLGYGLYIHEPWISFVACGSLLILGGLLMKEK